MKKIMITIVLISSLIACKSTQVSQSSGRYAQPWQRGGTYVKHVDKNGHVSYEFNPYEDWHHFDTSHAFPDTVYMVEYSHKKPFSKIK
jgi:hypothetical protein